MAINYSKIGYINDSEPAIDANNLNHMDDGIKQACDGVDGAITDIAKLTKFEAFPISQCFNLDSEYANIDTNWPGVAERLGDMVHLAFRLNVVKDAGGHSIGSITEPKIVPRSHTYICPMEFINSSGQISGNWVRQGEYYVDVTYPAKNTATLSLELDEDLEE